MQTNPDRIWKTEEAKFSAISERLRELGNGEAVAILVVSHFEETHERIEDLLREYQGRVPAEAVRADRWSLPSAIGSQVDETMFVDVIVAERHPSLEVDEGVVKEFEDRLRCRCRVTYYVSLECPWVVEQTGDFVHTIMDKMGMKDDEPIESAMVTRRITAIQKQIAQNVVSTQRARSAQEWIDKNVRKNRS
ncbi:preprotein translocase subunit SecA [Rhodopirellula sallentina]|uniref:preprotein translocase subunit SecA n=1 Tax=Rhodopirellula sallentina TaxID=1263869 RepID=UPI001F1E45B6|nr:preprotein translocase subunit SecA [Rhodopirellula sallentina]